MRLAAGIADTAQNARVGKIDVTSLKLRNQILLVEGFCGSVHVLERQNEGFREVWALRGLPDLPGWTSSSRTVNAEQHCFPSAKVSVTAESQIVIAVPVRLDPFERGVPTSRFTYGWDGSEYRLVEEAR